MTTYTIDDPATDLALPCKRILRSLPEWFGIEQAIVDYVRAIDQLPTFLARDGNGEAIGFMSVKRHFPLAAELYVLGIREEHHRRGVGRMLLDAVEAWLGRDGVRVLQVKTLSPARASAAYDATRRYYEAMGFIPIEEFPTLWGERNPCLMDGEGVAVADREEQVETVATAPRALHCRRPAPKIPGHQSTDSRA